MGKYMRKCSKGIGEVAVMEVTQVVGVRTRARALAMAAAEAAAGEASDAGAKRRKVDGGDQFCISYLQLRSRSLFLTRGRTRRMAAAATAGVASDSPATSGSSASGVSGAAGQGSGGGEWDRVSRCSSNASSEVLAAAAEKACSRSGGRQKLEGDDGSETTACNYDGELRRWRERITPSGELPVRESDNLESTASPGQSGRGQRRGSAPSAAAPPSAMVPSEAEIEEFFAAAERQEWKRFAEKYNYDVLKDVPLEGRYEWVQIKP